MFKMETERLRLREFVESDAAFVLELLNTKGWLDFIGDRKVRTEADAKSYITDKLRVSYTHSGFGFYLVELKDKAMPIGMCGLVKRFDLENVDLGFAFLPEYTRKGYAYEAAQACLSLAKGKLGIKKLAAITVAHNSPSINLLKKLKFEFDKIIQINDDKEDLMLFDLVL